MSGFEEDLGEELNVIDPNSEGRVIWGGISPLKINA